MQILLLLQVVVAVLAHPKREVKAVVLLHHPPLIIMVPVKLPVVLLLLALGHVPLVAHLHLDFGLVQVLIGKVDMGQVVTMMLKVGQVVGLVADHLVVVTDAMVVAVAAAGMVVVMVVIKLVSMENPQLVAAAM